MARRMKFADFKRRLESRRLSSDYLEDYLEIDPTAPRMPVRFRPGTLEDLPPNDYDVDHALYSINEPLITRVKRRRLAVVSRVSSQRVTRGSYCL